MSEDNIERDGIKWGAEIAVNRQEPEYIEAGQKCVVITQMSGPYGRVEKHPNIGWSVVNSIRLPADHPYYLATSRGFTYWPGGESAPDDWDESPVLLRDGETWAHADATEWQELGERTVIGYRKRSEPEPEPAPAIDPALVERMIKHLRDFAHWNATTDSWYVLFRKWQEEARDILKALEPVDPDEAIAEEIAASFNEGEHEAIALAALKRGRQLEREKNA